MVKRLNFSIFWLEVGATLMAMLVFGFFTVIGWSLLTSALGFWLLREQGMTWQIPNVNMRNLSNPLLRTLAGVLLLLPGVLTDMLGLICWLGTSFGNWRTWLKKFTGQAGSEHIDASRSQSAKPQKPHDPNIIEGEFWRDDEKKPK